MSNTQQVVICGVQSGKLLSNLSALLSFVSTEELLASLPQEHLLFERFSASYERSVNKDRLRKLESYVLKSVLNNTPLDVPKVSLVAYRNPHVQIQHNTLATLQYDKNDSAIVDGFLVLSVLSNLLGRSDPFTGKKADKSILTTKQKQFLASIDVQITIYYRPNEKINEETLSKLFFDINSIDTKIYSQNIITHVQESPLNLGAAKLALALNLEALGGVSELNKITKSDSYVTTKSTLVQILLAALGGKGTRIEKQLPTHLPNKTQITEQVVDEALKTVIPLMKGWISCLETQFRQDSNGFHRSMQVWQALGIVAYHLTHNNDLSDDVLFSTGQILGRLNYDKSAAHWGKCSAFKKDASGSFWINATGGGRTFRDKVALYFISLL
ncbi:TPA: hypothetical protein NKP43_001324 [Vibrio parahaemolyticus]|uniref:hypothetical protein n=1 Tax=Vibrio parahaemolyticus TaxID=670 RepID=UPI00111DF673|nr:hypothetical protein [Vibrio parahaemolyticus]MCX8854970.1 hypothetical protein [Vibrio parahaemolyticus]TOD57559.1 hypothetical protein CGJ61_23770 [Vibrio parahaemolyticus]HCE3379001.1 hypothetical protein [Vibrio parahaemolyticus]HCG8756100.1 hypothetical protein [Vibrio parahaemolyticus]HCH0941774.1 hypothetical protein [Vibrio parahaemolyticus]